MTFQQPFHSETFSFVRSFVRSRRCIETEISYASNRNKTPIYSGKIDKDTHTY